MKHLSEDGEGDGRRGAEKKKQERMNGNEMRRKVISNEMKNRENGRDAMMLKYK